MKKIVLLAVLFLTLAMRSGFAQDVTTVEAKSTDISDNLDLEAVASIFGESKDLEDFEKKLNDPKLKISNLDLNEDGNVDYLRVVETSDKDAHVVAIQAVIGKDMYQDVATVDVVKDNDGKTQVQVVGDVYMYGPDYIIQPVYYRPPIIFTFFWGHYHPWHSPYHWGHYPHYYHHWHPYPPHTYHGNININININNTYNRTSVNSNRKTADLHKKISRNDFAKSNPDKSFQKRNRGITNKQALDKNRINKGNRQKAVTTDKPNKAVKKSTTKPTNKSYNKPKSVAKPNKAVKKPAAKPTNKSYNRPKPATKPTNHKPAARPSTKQHNRPAPKPASHKPTSRPRPAKQPVKRGGRR